MEYWQKYYTQVYTQMKKTNTFAPQLYQIYPHIIYIYIKQTFKFYTPPSENEQY